MPKVVECNLSILVIEKSKSIKANQLSEINTRSVQKIRRFFELRGSSWFQENPLGVARYAQIS